MIKAIYTSLIFLSFTATAQDALQAETENGKPYLVHTVTSGETLSSLSRNFKLTVAEIATFNKISSEKGLQKDQAIRIPLKADNLTQSECSGCSKVYYKVQPREGLYRIGLNFGNIKAETLRKLNNLPGEAVDIGQNLLVGYLSSPAGKMNNMAQKVTAPPPTTASSSTTSTTDTYTRPETKPTETIKNNPPTTSSTPATTPTNNSPKQQPTQQPVVTQEPPKQQASMPTTTSSNNNNPGDASESGAFTNEYAGKMNVAKTGTAAVFKSTSGWGDAKFYVLMNSAAPGTIIKIQNAATSKTVYAKVLGELPQIKQNENVLLRISNAAASALGGGEENMSVSVNY